MEEQPFPKEITYMDTAFNALVYLDVIYVFIVISCLTFYETKIEMAMKHYFRPYRKISDLLKSHLYKDWLYVSFKTCFVFLVRLWSNKLISKAAKYIPQMQKRDVRNAIINKDG